MKRYLKFAAIIVVWGLVGGVTGVLVANGTEEIAAFCAAAGDFIERASPVLLPVFGGLPLLAGLFFQLAARRKMGRLTAENEEGERDVQQQLSVSLVCACIGAILLFFFAAAGFRLHVAGLITVLVEMIVMILLVVGLEATSIGLLKRLQPEKKGDPLQFRFSRDWVGSCDEAEKMLIYKSTYRSFCILNIVFPILTGIMMFSRLYFDTGLLPVCIVCICWGIHTVSYSLTSLRLSREKIEP